MLLGAALSSPIALARSTPTEQPNVSSLIHDRAHPTLSDSPYAILLQSYGPYLDLNDPRGWPMKIHAITSDPYKFWRGTKDLFFLFAKTHCDDWMQQTQAFLPTHGDLHLGNIGSYATHPLGQLAVGLVDFDDSARLPYQLELLQGAITFQLIAQTNNITLNPQQTQQLVRTLLDAYLNARQNPLDATGLINARPEIRKLLSRADRPYQRVVDQLTMDQKFKPLIPDNGPITNILDPLSTETHKAFATALQQLARLHPRLAELIGHPDTFSILHAVQRTRVGSSGSQGLFKILVLVRSADQVERIIYFKQQIPSAAERVGLIAPLATTPSVRSADHTRSLTDPDPLLALPCEVLDRSFVVNLYEPWSDELDHEELKTYEQLLESAQLWSNITGRAHQLATGISRPSQPDIQALHNALLERSAAYLSHNDRLFSDLNADPAAKAVRAVALDYLAKLRTLPSRN